MQCILQDCLNWNSSEIAVLELIFVDFEMHVQCTQ